MSEPFLAWNLPWSPPHLPRFARAARFRELHAAADEWIEQQFARIRNGADFLEPASRLVGDYGTIFGYGCRWSANLEILRVRFGCYAHVRLHRQVAVAAEPVSRPPSS
jgi:hypothetical protein